MRRLRVPRERRRPDAPPSHAKPHPRPPATPSRNAAIMAFQRAAGNRAAARLLANQPPRSGDTSAVATARPRAAQAGQTARSPRPHAIQRVVYPNMATMWAAVHPGYALANVQQDRVLSNLYDDAAAQLPLSDIEQVPNQAPQARKTASPPAPTPYRVEWDSAANVGYDNDYFAGAMLHELAHVASAEMYQQSGATQGELVWANMNLPVAVGVVNPANGLAPNQQTALVRQIQTLDDSWTDLQAEAQADFASGELTAPEHAHVHGRIQYALATSFVHNDTVLGDIMYWLLARNQEDTRTYAFARRMLKEANDRRRNGFWSNPGTEVRRVDSRAWWFQFWKW